MTTTTTITYLGITATQQEWLAVRLSPYADGTGLSASGWSGPEIPAELMAARASLPEDAPGHRVLGEFYRRHMDAIEERTRSTAVARLAESLRSVSGSVKLDASELVAAIEKIASR